MLVIDKKNYTNKNVNVDEINLDEIINNIKVLSIPFTNLKQEIAIPRDEQIVLLKKFGEKVIEAKKYVDAHNKMHPDKSIAITDYFVSDFVEKLENQQFDQIINYQNLYDCNRNLQILYVKLIENTIDDQLKHVCRDKIEELWIDQFQLGPFSEDGTVLVPQQSAAIVQGQKIGTINVYGCVTLIIKNCQTKKIALAHVDGKVTKKQIDNLFTMCELGDKEVVLVGGFICGNQNVQKIVESILLHVKDGNSVTINSASILKDKLTERFTALYVDPKDFSIHYGSPPIIKREEFSINFNMYDIPYYFGFQSSLDLTDYTTTPLHSIEYPLIELPVQAMPNVWQCVKSSSYQWAANVENFTFQFNFNDQKIKELVSNIVQNNTPNIYIVEKQIEKAIRLVLRLYEKSVGNVMHEVGKQLVQTGTDGEIIKEVLKHVITKILPKKKLFIGNGSAVVNKPLADLIAHVAIDYLTHNQELTRIMQNIPTITKYMDDALDKQQLTCSNRLDDIEGYENLKAYLVNYSESSRTEFGSNVVMNIHTYIFKKAVIEHNYEVLNELSQIPNIEKFVDVNAPIFPKHQYSSELVKITDSEYFNIEVLKFLLKFPDFDVNVPLNAIVNWGLAWLNFCSDDKSVKDLTAFTYGFLNLLYFNGHRKNLEFKKVVSIVRKMIDEKGADISTRAAKNLLSMLAVRLILANDPNNPAVSYQNDLEYLVEKDANVNAIITMNIPALAGQKHSDTRNNYHSITNNTILEYVASADNYEMYQQLMGLYHKYKDTQYKIDFINHHYEMHDDITKEEQVGTVFHALSQLLLELYMYSTTNQKLLKSCMDDKEQKRKNIFKYFILIALELNFDLNVLTQENINGKKPIDYLDFSKIKVHENNTQGWTRYSLENYMYELHNNNVLQDCKSRAAEQHKKLKIVIDNIREVKTKCPQIGVLLKYIRQDDRELGVLDKLLEIFSKQDALNCLEKVLPRLFCRSMYKFIKEYYQNKPILKSSSYSEALFTQEQKEAGWQRRQDSRGSYYVRYQDVCISDLNMNEEKLSENNLFPSLFQLAVAAECNRILQNQPSTNLEVAMEVAELNSPNRTCV